MKIFYKILAPVLFLALFIAPATCGAAPSLSSIDGYMQDSEWNGYQTVEYGNDYGDGYFDVEKLGLYIDDNMLYIGLQTDFNLDGGWWTNSGKYKYDEYGNKKKNWERYIDPGDFAFDFNGDGSYEAGIDFNLSGGDLSFTFFTIDDPDNWQNPKQYEKDAPYTAYLKNYAFSQKSGTGADDFEADIAYYDDWDKSPGDMLEAAINLDTLSGELSQLFRGTDKTLNLFWTMESGSDSLLVSETYSYKPGSGNQVPEPSTLVLLGMGLLGLGACSRERKSIRTFE